MAIWFSIFSTQTMPQAYWHRPHKMIVKMGAINWRIWQMANKSEGENSTSKGNAYRWWTGNGLFTGVARATLEWLWLWQWGGYVAGALCGTLTGVRDPSLKYRSDNKVCGGEVSVLEDEREWGGGGELPLCMGLQSFLQNHPTLAFWWDIPL